MHSVACAEWEVPMVCGCKSKCKTYLASNHGVRVVLVPLLAEQLQPDVLSPQAIGNAHLSSITLQQPGVLCLTLLQLSP